MSCPTCDRTMQSLAAVDDISVWWCPGCGTTVREIRNGSPLGRKFLSVFVPRSSRKRKPYAVRPVIREDIWWPRLHDVALTVSAVAGGFFLSDPMGFFPAYPVLVLASAAAVSTISWGVWCMVELIYRRP